MLVDVLLWFSGRVTSGHVRPAVVGVALGGRALLARGRTGQRGAAPGRAWTPAGTAVPQHGQPAAPLADAPAAAAATTSAADRRISAQRW